MLVAELVGHYERAAVDARRRHACHDCHTEVVEAAARTGSFEAEVEEWCHRRKGRDQRHVATVGGESLGETDPNRAAVAVPHDHSTVGGSTAFDHKLLGGENVARRGD